MTVLGWAGWWLGGFISPMTGFVAGCIASMAGSFVGWYVYSRNLS